jgi:broad specificity phosphatase PhoE
MQLLLTRHGRTAANVASLLDTAVPGYGLDDVGRVQADDLVTRVAEVDLHALFVSELPRTHQTVAPLAAARGLVPTVVPGLNEIRAGEHELSEDFMPYIEMLLGWPQDPLLSLPGGENALEFLARYDAAVTAIATSGASVALAVSHGAAMRAWCWSRVQGFADVITDKGLVNTAIVTIEGDQGSGWRLIGLDAPPEAL